MSPDRFTPTIRGRRCAICGGPVSRRTNTAAPRGHEDITYPLLHDDPADWRTWPHNVVLAADPKAYAP